MQVEEVGHIHVGDAKCVLVGVHPPASLALRLVVDLDPLNLELVAIVLVLAVERGVGVYPVDSFHVLSDQGEDFLFSLGIVRLLKRGELKKILNYLLHASNTKSKLKE